MNQATLHRERTTSIPLFTGGVDHTWAQRPGARTTLRVGVPNTGRLFELSGRLLSLVLPFPWNSRGLLFDVGNETEVLRARSTDLPHLLAHGIVDVAVTGSDYAFESGENVIEAGNLELISGRLCLLTASGGIPETADGSPFRISTQYPRYGRELVEREGLNARVLEVTGAGELYPRIGLAEASLDMVVTGETRRQNGLQIALEVVPVYSAVYVAPDLPDGLRGRAEEAAQALLRVRHSPEGLQQLRDAGMSV
jgi:ATP phosphoribosyltransferase